MVLHDSSYGRRLVYGHAVHRERIDRLVGNHLRLQRPPRGVYEHNDILVIHHLHIFLLLLSCHFYMCPSMSMCSYEEKEVVNELFGL